MFWQIKNIYWKAVRKGLKRRGKYEKIDFSYLSGGELPQYSKLTIKLEKMIEEEEAKIEELEKEKQAIEAEIQNSKKKIKDAEADIKRINCL